jgi:hypothetical protein
VLPGAESWRYSRIFVLFGPLAATTSVGLLELSGADSQPATIEAIARRVSRLLESFIRVTKSILVLVTARFK